MAEQSAKSKAGHLAALSAAMMVLYLEPKTAVPRAVKMAALKVLLTAFHLD
jgi:hypothetical protein